MIVLNKKKRLIFLLGRIHRINCIFDGRINEESKDGSRHCSDPVDEDVFGHGVALAAGEEDSREEGVEHAAGNPHYRNDDDAHENPDEEDRVDGIVVGLKQKSD